MFYRRACRIRIDLNLCREVLRVDLGVLMDVLDAHVGLTMCQYLAQAPMFLGTPVCCALSGETPWLLPEEAWCLL